MDDNGTDIRIRQSVIAIVQEEGKFKALELAKGDGAFEVLWTKNSEDSDMEWGTFAAECGLTAGPTGQPNTSSNRPVVGFDSAGVAFYHMKLPAVKEQEMASMVRLQAESWLPLPAEQMELAWRAGRRQNGQVSVTMAAARTEHLREFVAQVRGFEPASIILNCEAIAKACRELFGAAEQDAVIVSVGESSAYVCLTEDGQLSNAAVLDMGTDDFSAAGKAAEQTQIAGRFVQDMTSVLELFGYAQPAELPVLVLSNASDEVETMVTCLKSAGLNARAVLPQVHKLRSRTGLGLEGIYDYRLPLGLALMGLEAQRKELRIFERLYQPSWEKEKKSWWSSLRITGVMAAVMLAVLVIVSYAVDVASPGVIKKQIRASLSDTEMDAIMQRQSLIKAVARERPDLLDLLNQVNASGERGIKLTGLHFKKGQPVTITGQAQGTDQLYKFQENLLAKKPKGIKQVQIQNTSQDAKTKKLKFTMTFHYKNFTTQRTRKSIL